MLEADSNTRQRRLRRFILSMGMLKWFKQVLTGEKVQEPEQHNLFKYFRQKRGTGNMTIFSKVIKVESL